MDNKKEIKKQKSNKIVIVIAIIGLIVFIFGIFYFEEKIPISFNESINNSTLKNNSFYILKSSNISNDGFMEIQDFNYNRFKVSTNISFPDYSKEAYIQIKPKEKSKFIFLECINSTLKINNNSIYCERN